VVTFITFLDYFLSIVTTVIGEKSIVFILNADDTRVIADTTARLEARRRHDGSDIQEETPDDAG